MQKNEIGYQTISEKRKHFIGLIFVKEKLIQILNC